VFVKRLFFNVEVDRRGRPMWSTLQVTLRNLPKEKRERKKFIRPEAGTAIGRHRSAKDKVRRLSGSEL